MSKISLDDFQALLDAELPLIDIFRIKAEAIGEGTCRMRMAYREEMVRPGGTIAGPAMMALADACMYGVVLSCIGKVALAVTTNFNINFLRKPANTDLIALGGSIKLGKRLAVLEVSLVSEGDQDLVAHATGTYSIPPERA